MTLITGGAKCGKSALAESLLDAAPHKLYIATMIPGGQEAHEAIARHRRIRSGKGFETLELYTDLVKVHAEGKSVLLECLGNLCANELFREDTARRRADETASAVTSGLAILRAQARELVIVTNQVGADGCTYGEGTMEYIRLLGQVNQEAADMADRVIECVYGIPVILKEKERGEAP